MIVLREKSSIEMASKKGPFLKNCELDFFYKQPLSSLKIFTLMATERQAHRFSLEALLG